MRSVHSGMRISFSVLSALVFVLPLLFLSTAQAGWIVREDAELAPMATPAPAPSEEPAPQANEEKLSAPKPPVKAAGKCGGCSGMPEKGCPQKAKKECPTQMRAAKGACNATKPLDANATEADMAQLMEKAVEFRVQSLAQVNSDDPKVVELLAAKLSDKNPKVRREAVTVLGLLGAYHPEKSAEIFPYLLQASEDPDPKVNAAVLKAMMPTVAHMQEKEALPLLSDVLTKGNSQERIAVAAILAGLADKLPWANQLAGALTTALEDPNPEAQLAAIMALAFIDPSKLPENCVTLLKEAAASPSAGTRFQAFSLLSVLGPKAADALPELLKGVKDPHNVPRWAAIRALGKLGQDMVLAHPEILEALVQATGDENVPVQQMAALSLGANLGSPALPGVLPGVENAAAMDALQKLLESKERYVSETAGWALVRMEPKLRGALPEKIRARLPVVTPALDQMAAQ